MAVFLLDTDILTLYQRNHPQVLSAIANHALHQLCVSSITIEEQIGGWSGLARSAKSHQEQAQASALLASLVICWNRFAIVPNTESALMQYENLIRLKLNVRHNDLRIASIGLELGATIVTRNRRDFGRVPNLVIEDWSN
jgi:tRNA(fMet)-specific endonuclease VapC